MEEVTVYSTAMQAVRRTADNCRRLLTLLDAFGVTVRVLFIDSQEMRAFVGGLLNGQKSICWQNKPDGGVQGFQLPLCFVGPVLVGTYDELAELNEMGELPETLRAAGYSGVFRAAIHSAIPVVSIKTLAVAAAAMIAPADKWEEKECNGFGDVNDFKELGREVKCDDDANGVGNDDSESLPPPPPPYEDEYNYYYDDNVYVGGCSDDDDLPPPPPEEDDEEDDPPPPPPPEDENDY